MSDQQSQKEPSLSDDDCIINPETARSRSTIYTLFSIGNFSPALLQPLQQPSVNLISRSNQRESEGVIVGSAPLLGKSLLGRPVIVNFARARGKTRWKRARISRKVFFFVNKKEKRKIVVKVVAGFEIRSQLCMYICVLCVRIGESSVCGCYIILTLLCGCIIARNERDAAMMYGNMDFTSPVCLWLLPEN